MTKQYQSIYLTNMAYEHEFTGTMRRHLKERVQEGNCCELVGRIIEININVK